MKSIKTLGAIVLLTLTCYGADKSTPLEQLAQLAKQEQNLKLSIERLNITRDQVREEVLMLKREITALKADLEKARQQETNQVIIVKIILPTTSRPIKLQAEDE